MENTKIVYQFNTDNKYMGELLLDHTDISPSGRFNIPAWCTEIKPPEYREGFDIVWSNTDWQYVEIPKEPQPKEPTLDELKEAKSQKAGEVFATKRDAIRWVKVDEIHTYGFDCASEDITNFLAAYTFLDTQVEKSNTTMYKVWLDKENKGIVELNLEQMSKVFNNVRTSQFEAYAWLEQVQTQIEACQSKEELDNITLE